MRASQTFTSIKTLIISKLFTVFLKSGTILPFLQSSGKVLDFRLFRNILESGFIMVGLFIFFCSLPANLFMLTCLLLAYLYIVLSHRLFLLFLLQIVLKPFFVILIIIQRFFLYHHHHDSVLVLALEIIVCFSDNNSYFTDANKI